MQVLLNDGTTGTTEKATIGEIATIMLVNENGDFLEKSGIVEEILS